MPSRRPWKSSRAAQELRESALALPRTAHRNSGPPAPAPPSIAPVIHRPRPNNTLRQGSDATDGALTVVQSLEMGRVRHCRYRGGGMRCLCHYLRLLPPKSPTIPSPRSDSTPASQTRPLSNRPRMPTRSQPRRSVAPPSATTPVLSTAEAERYARNFIATWNEAT